eukprot:CAMPEP_0114382640 /NCGR_PEP_ID=MMETSP0102-20121206/4226_1 /TAXON_ID=38822 ORGANISM="Pteridomonas danica, Strain PT" /NCGR_SAMPLE_ID=MMETSP0102 /ASSEMBLY_ACC=CAM_ASM_000212 /LENGTH=1257 /DNA_ID=CAMNT_0001538473 /DNA_START=234 /DNA_END=4007 /DNA_ORIENTATION=+
MTPMFRSFLQGLLHKDPKRRLTWPTLKQHPFILETEDDRDRFKAARDQELLFGGAGPPQFRLEQFLTGIGGPSKSLPGMVPASRATSADLVEQRSANRAAEEKQQQQQHHHQGQGQGQERMGQEVEVAPRNIFTPSSEPTPPASHRRETAVTPQTKNSESGGNLMWWTNWEKHVAKICENKLDSASELVRVAAAHPEVFSMLRQLLCARTSSLSSIDDEAISVLTSALRVGERFANALTSLFVNSQFQSNEALFQSAAASVGGVLGSLVHFCEQLHDVVNRWVEASHRAAPTGSKLLSHIVRFLGLLVQLPCWSSEQGGSQTTATVPNDHGAGPINFMVGGRVSAAGRLTTISLLSALLMHDGSLWLPIVNHTLKCFGYILAVATPSDVDVLLVQQFPRRIVRCLILSLSNSTDLAETLLSSRQQPMFAIQTLALFVHPPGSQWKHVCDFPILHALNSDPSSNQHGSDGRAQEADDLEETAAWRLQRALAERRDLRKRLLDATSSALLMASGDAHMARKPALTTLCDIVCFHSSNAAPRPTGGEDSKIDVSGNNHSQVAGLVSACLRILVHTSRESVDVAQIIASHPKFLHAAMELLSRSSGGNASSSNKDNGGGAYSQGLLILLVAALMKQQVLNPKQAHFLVKAVTKCMRETSDIRVSSAATSALSATLFVASKVLTNQEPLVIELSDQDEDKQPVVVVDRQEDPTPIDWKEVMRVTIQGIAPQSSLISIRRLLCYRSESRTSEPSRDIVNTTTPESSSSSSSLVGEAVHLEGSEFGGRLSGMLDHTMQLLVECTALCPRIASKLLAGRLWQPLCSQISHGGNGELSPDGVIACLQLLKSLLSVSPSNEMYEQLLSGGVIRISSELLSLCHVRWLKHWPVDHCGGIHGIKDLLVTICALIRMPLPPQTIAREILVRWQQSVHAEGIMNGVLVSLSVMAKRIDTPPPNPPIDLLARLVLLSSNFLTQLMSLQGLATLRDCDAFSIGCPVRVIVNALLIACQAARTSEAHYRTIHNENLYVYIWRLLNHEDSLVREKVCNLIGNMCRHSAFFYKTLITPLDSSSPTDQPNPSQPPSLKSSSSPNHHLQNDSTILVRLIARCGDLDSTTRKFACFAVGNAAFHSSVLYPYLPASIPLLLAALRDPDEKTRANAAGALGNLVRNSSELSQFLIQHSVPEQLLQTALNDPTMSPRKIALFSLGTICIYTQLRPCLETFRPSFEESLNKLDEEYKTSKQPDPQMLEHVARIRKKLSQKAIK